MADTTTTTRPGAASLPKFYDDPEKTRMNAAIVDDFALDTVRRFLAVKGELRTSQLRRFYGDVRSLKLAWESRRADAGRAAEERKDAAGRDEEAFASILPQIKMLKAKVAYARARKVVPESFRAWLSACADAVNDARDFQAFLLHFEAVVGFAYGEGLKD